jgi:hypothetical protein
MQPLMQIDARSHVEGGEDPDGKAGGAGILARGKLR